MSSATGLGAALYGMYGLDGLRGPLFDPMIAEIKERERLDKLSREDPRKHRVGIFELCDDRDLIEKPIRDFLYDPSASILAVGTTSEFNGVVMSHWRSYIDAYLEENPEHKGLFSKFMRDSIRTSQGGYLKLVPAASLGYRGTSCKAIYVHYTIYNNHRGRQMIDYALPPCLEQS